MWLSQGDLFRNLLIPRAGVDQGAATVALTQGPALLVSHGCAIDKKRKGISVADYLTFVPVHDLSIVNHDKAKALRAAANGLTPYEVLYLGSLPGLGEAYAALNEPFTLPTLLLRTELRNYSPDDTGEAEEEQRLTPNVWDTRFGTLNPDVIDLLADKWNALWTRRLPA